MTIKAGPCGGDRGELKDMENTDNITSIDKIRLAYSTCIHAITITYKVDGVEQPPVTWGDPSNKPGVTFKEKKNEVKNKTCYPILPGPFAQFPLLPGEYITNVKGTYGTSDDDDDQKLCCLRALKFQTNKNVQGPFGKYDVGTRFELPAIHGKIVGFHGRSGGRLDALGVHIKV